MSARTLVPGQLSQCPTSLGVQALVAEGDRVACLHHLVGTHLGAFQAVPPSERPVRVGAIATCRLENGRVAETWLTADIFGLLMQIGAVPAPAAAA